MQRYVRYLVLDEVLDAHQALFNLQARPPQLSLHALLSALAAPRQTIDGRDAYPTVYDKAYAYARGIAHGHPYVDGNKRLAFEAVRLFLDLNDIVVRVSAPDALRVMDLVAQNRMSRSAFATWLCAHTHSRYSLLPGEAIREHTRSGRGRVTALRAGRAASGADRRGSGRGDRS